jgi:NADH-quinone oxidoreductase subunit E
MNTSVEKVVLTKALQQAIDAWLLKYPDDRKQSAVLSALRLVQEHNNGWLSCPWMDAVADYLQMPKVAVYEVATFYSMFNLTPIGKHKINVCTNVSCMLSGSEEIVAHLEKRLGIKCGQTTPDKRFTLCEVECLAACAAAPVCQVGKKYIEHLTPEKIDALIDELE